MSGEDLAAQKAAIEEEKAALAAEKLAWQAQKQSEELLPAHYIVPELSGLPQPEDTLQVLPHKG